jgi:putative transposase
VSSPFLGEGHRKVWARLRWQGVRTSKARLLRLMREAQLLAPMRAGHAHGPTAHDGTITTAEPDQMWGMDATSCLTRREGTATVAGCRAWRVIEDLIGYMRRLSGLGFTS